MFADQSQAGGKGESLAAGELKEVRGIHVVHDSVRIAVPGDVDGREPQGPLVLVKAEALLHAQVQADVVREPEAIRRSTNCCCWFTTLNGYPVRYSKK